MQICEQSVRPTRLHALNTCCTGICHPLTPLEQRAGGPWNCSIRALGDAARRSLSSPRSTAMSTSSRHPARRLRLPRDTWLLTVVSPITRAAGDLGIRHALGHPTPDLAFPPDEVRGGGVEARLHESFHQSAGHRRHEQRDAVGCSARCSSRASFSSPETRGRRVKEPARLAPAFTHPRWARLEGMTAQPTGKAPR